MHRRGGVFCFFLDPKLSLIGHPSQNRGKRIDVYRIRNKSSHCRKIFEKASFLQFSLTNIPDEFDVAKEAGCFNMMVGVAPTGVDGTKDYSECAAGQKDTGY